MSGARTVSAALSAWMLYLRYSADDDLAATPASYVGFAALGLFCVLLAFLVFLLREHPPYRFTSCAAVVHFVTPTEI